ncbi:MAG: RidA family protein [Acidimicrobiia bacterium]|nr:RidA family protein [Acidimicrobiia bacterium]
MTEIEHLRPTGLANNPTYTQVVTGRGARTVYVSGQVAIDAEGALVGGGDLASQTEQVMVNLGIALADAGASFDDVVKIVTYVVDYQPEHRAIIGKARGRHLPTDNPPASTLVGVTALAAPEYLVEIEAVAITD